MEFSLPYLRIAASRPLWRSTACVNFPRTLFPGPSRCLNQRRANCIDLKSRPRISQLSRSHLPARSRLSLINPGLTELCVLNPTNRSTSSQYGPQEGAASPRFFPAHTKRSVGYWLLASAASVFGIVVFGGLTRLTESGLSITEWKPVTGSLPPLNDQDWESDFAKYRASPEYKLLNPDMTLPEFKQIYYMEWTHRMWGRLVGLSFVIPAIYFVARRRVTARMSLRLLGIAGIIGSQGALGWWMVKSGLKDDLFAPGSHPRVSQYRLTAHLGTAFVCYIAMLWNGLSILSKDHLARSPTAVEAFVSRWTRLQGHRRALCVLGGLVFLTAMSGGLVAGLDAGLIYNEFPRMGLGYTPPISELFSAFYSQNSHDLWWRNMLENPSTVQLQHRILATTTFVSIMAYVGYRRFGRRIYSKGILQPMYLVAAFALSQVILGISTLIYMVPLPLAALHQAGSLALLTSIIWARHRACGLSRGSLEVLKRQIQNHHPRNHRSFPRRKLDEVDSR